VVAVVVADVVADVVAVDVCVVSLQGNAPTAACATASLKASISFLQSAGVGKWIKGRKPSHKMVDALFP